MKFTNVPGNQTIKANLLLHFNFEFFYTVSLSKYLIKNKNEYSDILNLIIYTLNISNPFSLQHAQFSLQIQR